MLVGDLVARSMRLLRQLDPNEAPEAQDYETAIVALNAMCRRWEANGIALGWNDVANPEETLPAPPEAEEALAFNLALVLNPEYGGNLNGEVVAMARDGLALLRRDNAIANPLGWDRCGYGYNTYTDQWGYGGTVR